MKLQATRVANINAGKHTQEVKQKSVLTAAKVQLSNINCKIETTRMPILGTKYEHGTLLKIKTKIELG